MPDRPLRITSVCFTPAGPGFAVRGLLGWVTLELGGSIALDGLAIRQTQKGLVTLTFPRRRDRSGREHPLIRPLGEAVRRDLETQVFRALGAELGLEGWHEPGVEVAE